MAHNLAKNLDGTYKMAYTGETPWHGLGTGVEKAMTSEEAIKLAGLDYEVGLQPVYLKLNGKDVAIPGKFGTYRVDIDLPFNTVGNRYTVIQNSQAFEFVDNIVGQKQAVLETAGALYNGERIFLSCKLPNNIRVKGTNDIIEEYMILVNDHAGNIPLYALFSPIRPVCHNTVTAALKNCSNKVVIRHTKNSADKIKMAAELMGLYNTYIQSIETSFNQMANTRVDIRDFVNGVFLTGKQIDLFEQNNRSFVGIDEISTKVKNQMDSVIEFYHSGIGQDMDTCKGTVYGGYQAITGYMDNVIEYDSVLDKFDSQYFGATNQKRRQKAFDLASSLILS